MKEVTAAELICFDGDAASVWAHDLDVNEKLIDMTKHIAYTDQCPKITLKVHMVNIVDATSSTYPNV